MRVRKTLFLSLFRCTKWWKDSSAVVFTPSWLQSKRFSISEKYSK